MFSLADIKPFVRYARYMTLRQNIFYPAWIPYDARLFYCKSGLGTIRVGESSYTMQSGSVLILPSGMEYTLMAPTDFVTYLALNFDYTYRHADCKAPVPPDIREHYLPERQFERIEFSDAPELNRPLYITDMYSIEKEAVKIEQEYLRQIILCELANSSLLEQILLKCLRHIRTQALLQNKGIADKILNYIHENYAQPLTNQNIAEEFNFHPNYISSVIKSYTGYPLHQYLIHIRISHAVALLDSNHYTIGEIAELCGFCDIYHLSKCFKKIIGVSPKNYRVG